MWAAGAFGRVRDAYRASVATLVFMVAQHGASHIFFVDGISPTAFFTGTTWNPHQADKIGARGPTVSALPRIVGSFSVRCFPRCFALPFALGSAIFVVGDFAEVRSNGVPAGRRVAVGHSVGRTASPRPHDCRRMVPRLVEYHGFRHFSGSIVLAGMILPTIRRFHRRSPRLAEGPTSEGALWRGASRWQTIWHVVLRAARPSLYTAVVLGMTRAFGEALGCSNGYRQRGAGARRPVHSRVHPHERADHGQRQRDDGHGVFRCSVVVSLRFWRCCVHLRHSFHRTQREA